LVAEFFKKLWTYIRHFREIFGSGSLWYKKSRSEKNNIGESRPFDFFTTVGIAETTEGV